MKRTLLSRKSIGLDLGGSALKAAVVSNGLWGPELSRSYVFPVASPGPEGSGDGPGSNLPDELARPLRRYGGPGVGLDGGRVFFRWLDLPKLTGLSGDKKRAAAAFALEKNLPMGLEDLAVDVGRWLKTGSKGSRALAFGVARSGVEDILARLARSGLHPRFISLDTLGLLRAAEAAGVRHGVVLDLGRAKTTILCLAQGRVAGLGFSQIAGAELEKHLIGSHGVEPGRASSRKELIASPQETEKLLGPVLEELAGEVGRVVRTSFADSDQKPQSLYLCGGSSRLPGIGRILGRSLSLETKEFNPLKKAVEPELIPAVGLALSGAEFDLGRDMKPQGVSRKALILPALALATALALGGANLHQALEQRRARLAKLVEAETALVKESAPHLTRIVSPLRQLRAELNKAKEEFQSLEGGQAVPVIDILSDLEKLASAQKVTLNEVVIDGPRITLSGLAQSFDTLSRFQQTLENRGGFSQVDRQSGKMEGGSAGVRFTLRMKR